MMPQNSQWEPHNAACSTRGPLLTILFVLLSSISFLSSSEATALALETLKNATYRGIEVVTGEVTLRDGLWEGAPFVAGGAARPQVNFSGDFQLDSDLDGDGSLETMVFLGSRSGGSGENLHLAVMGSNRGKPENLATVPLGDRLEIVEVNSTGHTITVKILRAGPGDPACCPGELATVGWEFSEGTLQESIIDVPPQRFTLETIAGIDWRLISWDLADPVTDDATATLQFQNEIFFGRGGCNRYSAPVSPTDRPDLVRIGPAMATRMACVGPGMEVETRFFKNLQNVRKVGFFLTRLGLVYEKDGTQAMMLFERILEP